VAISRRNFLFGAAGAGVGFGLGALSHQFPLASPHVGPDWAPGEQTFVASTCLLCPAHCGIRVRLVDGRPVRIDGNPLHPVNQGGLCPKGHAGLQLLYHPGRVKGPLRRVGPPGSDHFEPIAWDAALGRVASAVAAARASGDAVDWLVGDAAGVMIELVAGFASALRNSHVYIDDYRDGSAEVLRLCQGIATPPAFDLRNADLVLSFGAALAESWPALPLAARARDEDPKKSPRWIQLDVRLSRTAAGADEWVPVKPGTYGALALGLAYVIVKEGLYDSDAVSAHVNGWDDWTDENGARQTGFRTLVLRHGRPDEVSARTGVPIARLTALAKAFGGARRAVAVWDQSVAWRSGGLSDALAIHALNTLTGRLNRPGGLLVQSTMPSLPGPLDGVKAAAPALASTSWPPEDHARTPRVLFLFQSNPVAALPQSERVQQALARIPLVVSFSPFLDESARHAHLVLPDHIYLERWQDALAPAAVPAAAWGIVQPVVKPQHNTRATGDCVLDVARRLGADIAAWARWSSIEDLVHQRGAALAAAGHGSLFVDPFQQRELGELEARGWWLPHGQSGDEFWQGILASGGWFDPSVNALDGSALSQQRDGRVWIFPSEARTRLQKSGTPLAEGFLPLTTVPPAPDDPRAPFQLQLIPFRVMTAASGGTALMPWLLEHVGVLGDNAWETWVEIDPQTARSHRLESGDRVRIESIEGGFEATVRVFAGTQPGVVNVPYGLHSHVAGWGEVPAANPLAAVGRRADPVTGLPDWYSTRVRLVRI
jgi:anaerobic selenocysteine-containing dehydrogenase